MLLRDARFPGLSRAGAVPGADLAPPPRRRGEQLLAEMEAFVRRHPHFTLTGMARAAAGNAALPGRLRDGDDVQEVTCRRMREWMKRNGA